MYNLDEVVKGTGEVQGTNLWELQFDLNAGLGITLPKDYILRCESMSALPQTEVGEKTFTLHNYEITQPGIVKRKGEFETTHIEGTDAIGTQFLQDLDNAFWEMSESNATGKSVGWENIRSTVYAWLLDSQHKRTRGYKFMHCSILSKWPGDGLGNSDEVLKSGLKIKYAWWSYLK